MQHTFTNDQTGPLSQHSVATNSSRTLVILETLLCMEDSVVQLIQNIGIVCCAV